LVWCAGGIFAPSLPIGAGIGDGVAQLVGSSLGPALIAMGMARFLEAVTQAPLTAFIIVMEMVDGHSMVLSLMARGRALSEFVLRRAAGEFVIVFPLRGQWLVGFSKR
jgi:H+/Cl- antiporter ClcA